MEYYEAHQAGEDYGRGLVEEEVDPFRVRVKLEPAEREHCLGRMAGGSRIDRLLESDVRVSIACKGCEGLFCFDIPPASREKDNRKQ